MYKEGNKPDGQITSKACVRFLNASPDINAMDIYVNGRIVVDGLKYKAFSHYDTPNPGVYNISCESKDGVGVGDVIELYPGMTYTLAAAGPLNAAYLEFIPGGDPGGGEDQAHLRFINLSCGEDKFDVYLNGSNMASALASRDITDYYPLEPTDYLMRLYGSESGDLEVKDAKIKLEAGKLYACYIVGAPGSIEALLPLE